ncbi:sushi, von Willebrand factor type A, EGF and pentraxin domain-containing protein 1-like [Corticium candelabrum]|uniref:sushi, von Willebrand factor type A, EGF and pentraxin domain-containing protein 1-like n=1 Tax=Corticium candelabrum TaxID=121492 RepID=UPI002E25F4F6|nr:sushi, von Willebrand factor type A, EGF and pentraxin domain-containing protein 1-like [Corticium candelabrum]
MFCVLELISGNSVFGDWFCYKMSVGLVWLILSVTTIGSTAYMPQTKCSTPTAPQEGSVHTLYKSYLSIAVATYSCSSGYHLYGSRTRLCVGGHWLRQQPTCEREVCSHLKDPVGGTVRIVYHVGRRSGFASYSCNVGYRLQGERLRNCVKGQWLGEKPVCSTKVCSRRSNPVGGFVKIVLRSQHTSGVATYSCKVGYDLKGESVRKCVEGHWQGSKPSCSIKECRFPPPSEFSIGPKVTSHNGLKKAKYQCRPHYKMRGQKTLICRNGVVNGNAPTCHLSKQE